MQNRQDQQKRITSRDVAAHAGVSQNTVSLVLRDSPLVRTETAERVRRSIAALGYRPNALAAALKGRRASTIGLIMHARLADQFAATVADTVIDVAQEAGYRVLIDTFAETAAVERADELLASKRVDGAIIHAYGKYTGYLNRLIESGYPVVAIGDHPPEVNINCVRADDGAGSYAAVSHLIQLGFDRIGAIAPRDVTTLQLAQDRMDGYIQALKDHKVPIKQEWIATAERWNMEHGFNAMQLLLALPQRPRAIFAFSDMLAIGAIEAVQQAGLRVPQDFAFASFDNIIWASYITPHLTTVNYPMREMARLATTLLLDQIHGTHGTDNQVQHIVLPATLIVRESCGTRSMNISTIP